MHRTNRWTLAAAAATLLLSGCAASADSAQVAGDAAQLPAGADTGPLPGMPPLVDPHNVYAADTAGSLAPQVQGVPERVYVPNTNSNTVTVIDPKTFQVIDTEPVGQLPQHVVPSWDLKTLWVNNNVGNSLTPIDPMTGKFGEPVPVNDPYNLYFTPDGKSAVVMEERDHQISFRDPTTMALQSTTPTPCEGVNHADWTADGRYFLASCEFSGQMLWIDTEKRKVTKTLQLPGGGMPQDVKLSPDGSVFYAADMMSNGVWVIDAHEPKIVQHIATGAGAHGLYPSRDAQFLYISNRGEGTVSVLRFADRKIVATWQIPGGSPDMGGVSADGKTLWLSGRYSNVVYVLDTTDGHLVATVPVGSGPHGLAFFPQPGRYSLGHTGVYR